MPNVETLKAEIARLNKDQRMYKETLSIPSHLTIGEAKSRLMHRKYVINMLASALYQINNNTTEILRYPRGVYEDTPKGEFFRKLVQNAVELYGEK